MKLELSCGSVRLDIADPEKGTVQDRSRETWDYSGGNWYLAYIGQSTAGPCPGQELLGRQTGYGVNWHLTGRSTWPHVLGICAGLYSVSKDFSRQEK